MLRAFNNNILREKWGLQIHEISRDCPKLQVLRQEQTRRKQTCEVFQARHCNDRGNKFFTGFTPHEQQQGPTMATAGTNLSIPPPVYFNPKTDDWNQWISRYAMGCQIKCALIP